MPKSRTKLRNAKEGIQISKQRKIPLGGNRPELTDRHHKDMVQAFGCFDKSGSGVLLEDEAYRCIALTWRALGKDPTDKNIYELIGHLRGKDSKDITMDFNDYFCIVQKEMLKDESPSELRTMFDIFSTCDTNNPEMEPGLREEEEEEPPAPDIPATRHIRLDNLKAISKELESDLTTDQMATMISYADLNRSGGVSFNEFKKIMDRPISGL